MAEEKSVSFVFIGEEKRIKHFVEVRFFPGQAIEYLYNVRSRRFLEKQLPLAKNSLKSLNNQTNKNFEIVVFTHPTFFDNPKYEFIFKEFKQTTTLPITFVKSDEMDDLLKRALDEYEFVIQSRMDFDDFIYKDAVADTQSKVSKFENILSYGYCKGYSYLDGELLPHYYPFDGIGHLGIFQSLIVRSSFAKKLPLFTPYFGSHNKIKDALKKFLTQNGVEFSENMFLQNLSTNAYIYFRHEFAHFLLTTGKMNPTVESQKENKLTAADITKQHLKEEFGFDLKLNSIK